MKKMIAFLLFFSASAFASDCVLTVTRTACPGHEAESYSKCDGHQTCTMKSTATSEQDCAAQALNECINTRLTITKSKIVTADIDGKPVEGGKNFCDPNRPDFNKCSQ